MQMNVRIGKTHRRTHFYLVTVSLLLLSLSATHAARVDAPHDDDADEGRV